MQHTYYVIVRRFIHTDKCCANYASASKRDAIANEWRFVCDRYCVRVRACVCACVFECVRVREQANVW